MHMPKEKIARRLQQKLFWTFLGIFASSVLTIAAYFLFVVRPTTIGDKETTLSSKLESIATEINSLSRERLNIAIALARKGEFLHAIIRSTTNGSLSSKEESERVIGKFLSREVESFPFIIGAGFFYEPFAFDTKEQYRGFYARWVPPLGMTRKVEFTMARSTPQANYHNSDWYRSLIPNGWTASRHLYADSTWTDPYRDTVTLVPMLSVLAAMYSEDASLIGLSSVDWNLDQLTDVIDKSRPTKNSIAALFSPNTKKFAAVAGLQGLNLEPIEKAKWMPSLLFNAPVDRFEMVAAKDEADTSVRVYSRTLENGLVYSLIIPEHEIFAEVQAFDYQQLALLACLFFTVFCSLRLAIRYYIDPISALSMLSQRYAKGDFTDKLEVRSDDEIQMISDSMMEFKEYLKTLDATTLHLLHGDISAASAELPGQDEAQNSLQKLSTKVKSFVDDIDHLHQRILQGETAARMNFADLGGEWRTAARNINQILETFDSLFAESISICKEALNGNFSSHLQGSRPGVFDSFRRGINEVFDIHKKTVKDLNAGLEAIRVAREETLLSVKAKKHLLNQVCEDAPRHLKQVISSLSAMQAAGLMSHQTKEALRAKEHCGKLLSLFDNLTNYAQLEEGRIELLRTRFNLHSLLFDLKDMLRLHTMKRRQEFSLVVDSAVPEYIIGDPSVLQNILLGLGSQSVRYTEDEGSISIRVELIETTLDTHTIQFTLSDTGSSLVESHRRTIINSIHEQNVEKAAMEPGGGLNLVIATRLAELMGGSLTFSQPSELGSQCQLRIQVQDPETVDISHVEALEELASVGNERKLNVLVVEDDILSQKFVSQLLKKQGCTSVAAGDGYEALHLLEQQRFDLVLMDITLPTLDGIETTKRIRSSGKSFANIPIVAVTAHPLKLSDPEMNDNGFNAFLLKPLESSALRETLSLLGTYNVRKAEKSLENTISTGA